jgi:hypothetical protein
MARTSPAQNDPWRREEIQMAELKESAAQFVNDLKNQNIAGLMMAFTPTGMGKAMAMQAQMQSQGGPQPILDFTIADPVEEGDHKVLEITLKNAGGEGVMVTKWISDATGAWKVDDIGMKA